MNVRFEALMIEHFVLMERLRFLGALGEADFRVAALMTEVFVPVERLDRFLEVVR